MPAAVRRRPVLPLAEARADPLPRASAVRGRSSVAALVILAILSRMTYLAAEDRYDHMQYRRTGRWGLKLPAISLGL